MSLKKIIGLHENCHRHLNLQDYIFKNAVFELERSRDISLKKDIFNTINLCEIARFAFFISSWDEEIDCPWQWSM